MKKNQTEECKCIQIKINYIIFFFFFLQQDLASMNNQLTPNNNAPLSFSFYHHQHILYTHHYSTQLEKKIFLNSTIINSTAQLHNETFFKKFFYFLTLI